MIQIVARLRGIAVEVVTTIIQDGNNFVPRGLRIDGPGAGTLGVAVLRELARELGRYVGARRIVIWGECALQGPSPAALLVPSSLWWFDVAHIILTGWLPGLQKVALTNLLHQQAGLSLAEANACFDRCLAGEPVTITMTSVIAAESLARAATRLGAVTETASAARPR